jgi:hypothetical protein
MTNHNSWAKALVIKLTTQMALVQYHAAERVKRKGGHDIAQACAAVAAREQLLDAGSAANAIEFSIKAGMYINAQVNTIHYLKSQPCQ